MNLFECAIDGAYLSELPYNIVLYDIIEAPAESIASTPKSIGNGSAYIRQQRESLSVTLRLAIREQDTAKRMEAFAAVQQWAKGGGILTRSDRVEQLLAVECVTQPVMASALKWTEMVDLTFVAHGDPYWRSTETVAATITDRGSLIVPGTAPECKAAAVITPTGELTTVTIDTGLSRITLDELMHTQPINIGHDANGYLSISSAGQSLLLQRTIDSSDELLVACGANAISVTANVPVSVEISARGAWL